MALAFAPIPTPAAAVYVRISKDALQRGLGVARQERDCRELAAQRGWAVADVYVDNDRSATRKGGRAAARPDYQRLLADIEAGRVGAVLSWELDRLVRDPLEHEEFLLRCERAGMHHLATLADDVNVETGEGLMIARIKAAVAAEEVRKMAKRVRRKLLELAEGGKPTGGGRPFGYRHRGTRLDGGPTGPLEVVPAEAALIGDAARRVLQGRSLGALVREWNDAGIVTVTGKRWRQTTLRDILLRPGVAGLRVHQGAVIGAADWPPILARETWEAVRAVLTAPERLPSGHRRTYLLTGLLTCGRPGCGRRLSGATAGTGKRRGYKCSVGQGGCGRLAIDAIHVEAAIVATLFKRASDARLSDAWAAGHAGAAEGETATLMERIAAGEARLAELARAWAEEGFSREYEREARRAIETRMGEAREQLARLERAEARPLAGLLGPGVLEAAWAGFTPEERRAVLGDALDSVTILPAVIRGRGFDPGRVDPHWKF